MKVEAIRNVKYNGEYRMPGTIFECEDKVAKVLLKKGAVTKELSKEMIAAAAEKLQGAIKDRQEAKKALDQAVAGNKEKQKKLDQLKDKIAREKDASKLSAMQKEAKDLSAGMRDTKRLEEDLERIEQEIKKYKVA